MEDHRIREYLLVVKPMTDVSSVRLINRSCGCGNEFRTSWGSKQDYCSNACAEIRGIKKNHRSYKWSLGQDYMMRGS